MQENFYSQRIAQMGLGDYPIIQLIDLMPRPQEIKLVSDDGIIKNISANEIKMKINYPNYSPLDHAVVTAARTSFLGESKGEEQDMKLLKYLYTHKHTTPFEMVQFKFRLVLPQMVWWQLVRHRTFSFNLESLRYKEPEDKHYLPANWRKQSTSNKQGSEGELSTEDNERWSDNFINWLDEGQKHYEAAIGEGIAKEMARMFIPISIFYEGVVSADLHNLLHFFRLRCDKHAQREIKVVADCMRMIVMPYAPATMNLFNEEINGKSST